MCGRYASSRRPEDLIEEFEVADNRVPAPLASDFNVAPTKEVYAVLERPPRSSTEQPEPADAPERQLRVLRWGLVPSWAKDPSIGNRMINARAETLLEKPAFRQAFAKRRCLVLADGFYEWQGKGKGPKQPFWFRRADGGLITFAGLWDQWVSPDGEPIETCTIITTSCNETLRPVHARMPVIIAPADRPAWLDCANPVSAVASMLVPAPDDLLVATPVSAAVNSPTNDGPALIVEALVGANDSPELDLL